MTDIICEICKTKINIFIEVEDGKPTGKPPYCFCPKCDDDAEIKRLELSTKLMCLQ